MVNDTVHLADTSTAAVATPRRRCVCVPFSYGETGLLWLGGRPRKPGAPRRRRLALSQRSSYDRCCIQRAGQHTCWATGATLLPVRRVWRLEGNSKLAVARPPHRAGTLLPAAPSLAAVASVVRYGAPRQRL